MTTEPQFPPADFWRWAFTLAATAVLAMVVYTFRRDTDRVDEAIVSMSDYKASADAEHKSMRELLSQSQATLSRVIAIQEIVVQRLSSLETDVRIVPKAR